MGRYFIFFLWSAGWLFNGSSVAAQNIQPYFFGQNAWMPDTIGIAAACASPPCYLNGKLHKQWGNITGSGARSVRFGGIAADRNRPTNFQYIKMIDSIRAKGMEPVIQVPFDGGVYTAAQAAAIVQHVNITKQRNVKYWIIGNEPDLAYSYNTASQVAVYFKSFASAMKAVDPTILTIGPECAWYNSSIINGLTTPGGAYDITGRDSAGRFYIDIVSFHTYPFNGSQTRDQVITKITQPGGFAANLATLNTRLANCNAFHNRSGPAALTAAVTEANINWQNNSLDNLNGVGVNSFIGGQFIAEMFGAGMKHGLSMMNIWSVVEGNSVALNIGYIDPASFKKKPVYYHYKMAAENFSGVYADGVSTFTNVKAFGSRSAQQINVMIMNQDAVNNHSYTVRLNTAAIGGTMALKININASVAVSYTDNIDSQSTQVLTFDVYGNLLKKQVYGLSTHAQSNLRPSLILMAGALPVSLSEFAASREGSGVVLRWTTQSERNNAGFIVQKSVDGYQFNDINFIEGVGTSSSERRYETTDDAPGEGTVYYRLAQVDFSGEQEYSQIVAVQAGVTQLADITVYPNPSYDGQFTVTLSSLADRAFELVITDMYGRKVHSAVTGTDDDGNARIPVNSQLSPGIYLIHIHSEHQLQTEKIIIK